MKSSIRLSIPTTRKVCGYPIRRVPLGTYLSLAERLPSLPAELMEGMFPGKTLEEILAELQGLTGNRISELILRLAAIAPGIALPLIAEMTGIDEDKLVNDPAIGLNGLAQIVLAWMEVNEIENFILTVGAMVKKLKAVTVTKDGSKG